MQGYDFLKDRVWLAQVVRDAFGKSFVMFVAFATAAGIACFVLRGPDVFREALAHEIHLLGNLIPRALLALSIAAIIWAILPRDRVARLVGKDSGFRGLLVALAAGTVTPGGPSSGYALLGVLAGAGADRGALVTYITAWAMLGIQRIVIWDLPFMGTEFALLRFASSIAMPLIAGLIARRLSWPLQIPATHEAPPR